MRSHPPGYANSLAPSLQSSTRMTNLSPSDLANIIGGTAPAKPAAAAPPSFNSFESGLKGNLEGDYKSLVCEGAGYQGGQQLAQQMYGANATDNDKIRASKLITDYCNAGTQLPAAAPKFPFS
jgi:hypothetical protein